jgi:hypothetical protein
VTPLKAISLLVVPASTDGRIIREFRAGGVKVERAQTLRPKDSQG